MVFFHPALYLLVSSGSAVFSWVEGDGGSGVVTASNIGLGIGSSSISGIGSITTSSGVKALAKSCWDFNNSFLNWRILYGI